jgi:hypothetical protein
MTHRAATGNARARTEVSSDPLSDATTSPTFRSVAVTTTTPVSGRRTITPAHILASILAVTAACTAGSDVEGTRLPNSSGKDDSVAIRLKLTDSAPVASFIIGCDQAVGCAGSVNVRMKTPDPCALFPNDARCGIARTQPMARDVLSATIISTTEGSRTIPLRIESGDGMEFTRSIAAAFTANAEEDVEITLEKTAGTPDLTIEVQAVWQPKENPNAEIDALTTFLRGIPGMEVAQETGTASAGYRAFYLRYEQPIDHDNPTLGTFKQAIVLHHRVKTAPMVLYTSGYSLFSLDELSELGTGMQANQISTEQRWFGESKPANATPEQWQYVNIQQAAKDHHRIVQALKPFYSGKWLSTGHSKGGMTSIFHRRFFPDDVDVTVPYVAPISFAVGDPRYVPFLDQIGEEQCRKAIRAVQKNALEKFDELVPMARANFDMNAKFDRSGGFESSFEKSILSIEWGFWQYQTAADCAPFLSAATDTASVYSLVSQYGGVGVTDDQLMEGTFVPYYYQAITQLGLQAFSTTDFGTLVKHEDKMFDYHPDGTMPSHERMSMDDVQAWVKSDAHQMLFIYGGSDPWTGGAYEIGTQADVVKLTAPAMSHMAEIKSLTPADKELALAKLEAWMGVKPTLAPTPTPGAPMPRIP